MIPDLILLFRTAALEKADFASPPERDHELHEMMARAVRELYALGQPGHDAFDALLHDPSHHVRGWAAAQLLVEGNVDAANVLADLAKGSGFAALDARTVLSQHAARRHKSPFGIEGRRLTRR